ncbi:MAG: hypothetical protein HYW78_04170, partial [Parcubacteria group bacterium]|nr:hypothetical protein [Parcubacteria group bacterium]
LWLIFFGVSFIASEVLVFLNSFAFIISLSAAIIIFLLSASIVLFNDRIKYFWPVCVILFLSASVLLLNIFFEVNKISIELIIVSFYFIFGYLFYSFYQLIHEARAYDEREAGIWNTIAVAWFLFFSLQALSHFEIVYSLYSLQRISLILAMTLWVWFYVSWFYNYPITVFSFFFPLFFGGLFELFFYIKIYAIFFFVLIGSVYILIARFIPPHLVRRVNSE